MEQVSESCSYDEDLLDAGCRARILDIARAIREFPKRNGVRCALCQEELRIRNLHDMFRVYGSTLWCLVHHVENVGTLDVRNLAIVECFILKCIQGRQLGDVCAVLEYQRGVKDVYEEALREQLVAVFRAQFAEVSMKINCEQEVESIVYKYHKLMNAERRRRLSIRDVELILVLLFKRNEFIRFFRVFDAHRKTHEMFRLALLLSTDSECHVSTHMLLKNVEDLSFERSEIMNGENAVEGFEDVWELIADTEMDAQAWIERHQERIDWEECVRMWAVNREHGTGAVDNSMVELCIKHKRYEDGWLIYERGRWCISVCKVCTLCLSGWRDTKEGRWIERMAEVVGYVALNDDSEQCCAVAESILMRIVEIPQECKVGLLKAFSEIVSRADGNEDVVNSLLKGFLSLCSTCSDPVVCSLCAEYADKVYKRWKKSREGFLFFRKQGKHDSQIYNSMLGVCDAVKDCEGFYNVCRDLMNTNSEVSKEMCARLERFHDQSCNDCALRRRQITTRRDGKILMLHFLNK